MRGTLIRKDINSGLSCYELRQGGLEATNAIKNAGEEAVKTTVIQSFSFMSRIEVMRSRYPYCILSRIRNPSTDSAQAYAMYVSPVVCRSG